MAAVLGAEANARSGIDAHALEVRPAGRDDLGRDVPEEAISDRVGGSAPLPPTG
jgi:hypothetical protein